MRANEARKLATEMAPIQAEKERLAAEAERRYLAEQEARQQAEEAVRFEERYGKILGQIEWAAKKGLVVLNVDCDQSENKLAVLKRLHADGYKAYQTTRIAVTFTHDGDGYQNGRYTHDQPCYRIEW